MGNLTEKLEGLSVLNASGDPLPVGELWSGKTTVIGFVRHFG